MAFRRPPVGLLQRILASSQTITHQSLDEAGPDQATRAVRSLLVDAGLLPVRDNNLARFEQWINTAADQLPDPEEQRAFRQFARWRHLRQLRQRPHPVPSSLTISRRRELRIVIGLLTWARKHGRTLRTLTQSDVDRWRAAGQPEAHRAWPLLAWAWHNRLARRLTVARTHRPGLGVTGTNDDERKQLLEHVLDPDSSTSPTTRLAAAIVLLYGAAPHQLTRLRISDVSDRDGQTYLSLGEEALLLPEVLADLANTVCRDRTAPRMFTPAHDGEWLFPGMRSGYPLSNTALINRPRAFGISPANARTGALAALAQELPPTILARLTGIHPGTAIRWTDAVAASNARYAALVLHTATGKPPNQ